MVRWPKVSQENQDLDAKDWWFNPHHGHGEKDIWHCQKIGLTLDMTALSINRPCGLAPCKERLKEHLLAPFLLDFATLGYHTCHGGDTSVTQTLQEGVECVPGV